PGDDRVAEGGSQLAETLDLRLQIVRFDGEAVPASGRLLTAVGHRLTASAARVRRTQDEAKLAAGQHGKSRRGVHDLVKAELITVEGDCRVDVSDDVANLHAGHGSAPCGLDDAEKLGTRGRFGLASANAGG